MENFRSYRIDNRLVLKETVSVADQPIVGPWGSKTNINL